MSENNSIEKFDGQPSQGLVDQVKRESYDFMNPARWETMNRMATVFHTSGAMPKDINSVPKLMVIMQAGIESGLQPLEAMNSFYLVNGKVSMYGKTAISQVLRAGHKITWGECNDTTATVTITRGDNGEKMKSTFTMKMAQERGLTSNAIYKKFPENMLKFKAFNMVSNFLVPDALKGIPIKEDLEGSEDEPKDVTDASTVKSIPATTAKPITHKPLDETMKEPEPTEDDNDKFPPEKPKRKKTEKPKNEMKVEEVVDGEVEKPVEEESFARKAMREAKEKKQADQARYERLVDKELNAPSEITSEERAFLENYKQ